MSPFLPNLLNWASLIYPFLGVHSLLFGDGAAGGGGAGGASPPIASFLFPILTIGLLFYLMILKPDQKKRAEHANMLKGLKKNDRVITIGGLYGTVVNVNRDTDDVTIKIDESTNTKVRVLRSAISRMAEAAPTTGDGGSSPDGGKELS